MSDIALPLPEGLLLHSDGQRWDTVTASVVEGLAGSAEFQVVRLMAHWPPPFKIWRHGSAPSVGAGRVTDGKTHGTLALIQDTAAWVGTKSRRRQSDRCMLPTSALTY